MEYLRFAGTIILIGFRVNAIVCVACDRDVNPFTDARIFVEIRDGI